MGTHSEVMLRDNMSSDTVFSPSPQGCASRNASKASEGSGSPVRCVASACPPSLWEVSKSAESGAWAESISATGQAPTTETTGHDRGPAAPGGWDRRALRGFCCDAFGCRSGIWSHVARVERVDERIDTSLRQRKRAIEPERSQTDREIDR